MTLLSLVACAAQEAADTTPPLTDTAPPTDTSTIPTDTPVATIHLEPLADSPSPATTPPTWNANLPKLASDGTFLYAVHTFFADNVADRYAAILVRDPTWREVARVSYVHQPPGLVIDTLGQLHLVFACQQVDSLDVTCFPGGAGTQGLPLRFYHLVFEARDDAGILRFDTYTNVNEWPGATNGYLGLGTGPDGVTTFSLADSDWSRHVFWWADTTTYGTVATLATDAYYLYPIHAQDHGRLLLYAGEFVPGTGSNASYRAATAFLGTHASLSPHSRTAPTTAATLGAFPNDAAFIDDEPSLLTYVDDGTCRTDLDGTTLPCLGTYAKRHESWILAPGGSTTLTVIDLPDVTPLPLPVEGLVEGDASFTGITLLPPSAPGYDPDRIVFFAAGLNTDGLATRSYLGTVTLPEE